MRCIRPVLFALLACPLAFGAASNTVEMPGRAGGEDFTGAAAEVRVLTLPGAVEVPSTPEPPPATTTMASYRSDIADEPRPILRRPKSIYPDEMIDESAAYLQHRLGSWTEESARQLLGEPVRHRFSFDSDKQVNGHIYTFSDPTKRYREFELDFDKDSGFLRTVFVYPWRMTWEECRKLWGAGVSSTEAYGGRTFYSYVNRRLDVLVDRGGKVINFGLY